MKRHLVLALALIGSGCGGGRPATVATNVPPPAAPVDASVAQPEASPPVADAPVAKPKPPLPQETRIGCDRVVDPAVFTTALGETAALTVKDVTKQDPDAAAVCSLVRGGKPLSAKQQENKLKKGGRLGVLPGDELCRVTAYCWTIEDPVRFAKRCTDMGNKNDDAPGACVQVVMQGANDVNVYRMFDDDTRCILGVSGGPGNTDNELIRACAKTARDQFGPAALSPP